MVALELLEYPVQWFTLSLHGATGIKTRSELGFTSGIGYWYAFSSWYSIINNYTKVYLDFGHPEGAEPAVCSPLGVHKDPAAKIWITLCKLRFIQAMPALYGPSIAYTASLDAPVGAELARESHGKRQNPHLRAPFEQIASQLAPTGVTGRQGTVTVTFCFHELFLCNKKTVQFPNIILISISYVI